MNPAPNLEEALRNAAGRVHYPPTPRLAARARAELEASASPRPRRFGIWSGLAAAACALLLVAAAAALYLGQTPVGAPALNRAYTANLLSGDLTVVDLRSNMVTGSIPVGDSPWGIVASRDGKRIYVAVVGGIAVVDTARGQRVDFVSLPTGYSRSKVAISVDERILLVASPTGQMVLIDMASRGVLNDFAIDMLPYDIKLSPDGHFAYVLSEVDGAVAVVDVRAGRLLNRLTFSGAYRGYYMAQSPDGRLLYVPRLGKSELWLVDTTNNLARVIQTETPPYWQVDPTRGTERGLAVSADGRRLYIVTQDDQGGGVSVLDTTTFKELMRASLGGGFFGAALSPDGARLLLTSPDNNRLTILDAATLSLVTSIEVGQVPYRIVVAGP
jgi:YVTN family beta-propeller protein